MQNFFFFFFEHRKKGICAAFSVDTEGPENLIPFFFYGLIKIYFKYRKTLYGSTFIWLLPHANLSSVAICDDLKSVLKWMRQRVIW